MSDASPAAPLAILDDRYERLARISWWDQECLRRAKVMVVGAGALGNEILKQLALLGIGRIALVDFDEVAISNLSRSILFRREDNGKKKALVAAARLKEINPDVRVLPLVGEVHSIVGTGFVRRMDLVLAGVDSVQARLQINELAWRAGVPWIDGALHELDGTMRVFMPPSGPCYECGLSDADYQQANLRHSCQLLPRNGLLEMPTPTSPTSAAIVGAWQAQEAVKWLHGQPIVAGQAVSYYGRTHEYFRTHLRYRESCPAHDERTVVLELPEVSSQTTAGELLELLSNRLESEVTVELDREVLLGFFCSRCDVFARELAPRAKLTYESSICPNCGSARDPRFRHRLEVGDRFAAIRLSELGIPCLHTLRVRCKGGFSHTFELTGDLSSPDLADFFATGEKHVDP